MFKISLLVFVSTSLFIVSFTYGLIRINKKLYHTDWVEETRDFLILQTQGKKFPS